MERILVMDVGNTVTALGVYEGAELKHRWRISTVWNRTSDEIGSLVASLFRETGDRQTSLDGVVISSVVPPLMPMLDEMCRNYFGRQPLIVGPGIRTGLVLQAENPREIGADRIANAVAALHLYQAPFIVVDMGTASTFSVIDDNGSYIGGLIAPGLQISAEALFEHTAKLPRVDLVQPKHVIGKSTVASLQSGILYGYTGMVDGIIERIRRERPLSYTIIGTGGFAELVGANSKSLDIIEPHLTLEGLRVLWERNRGDANTTAGADTDGRNHVARNARHGRSRPVPKRPDPRNGVHDNGADE